MPSSWLELRIPKEQGLIAHLPGLAGLFKALGHLLATIQGPPGLIHVERVGRHGSTFLMPKFRTMDENPADRERALITATDDQRVTTAGRILRRLHLDELPQLAAVAAGDMALIGPRPEDPAFVAPTDDWNVVLAVPPGITGLTQLLFAETELRHLKTNGTASYTQLVPRKLALDRWYVENASVTVDLLILASHLPLIGHFSAQRLATLVRGQTDGSPSGSGRLRRGGRSQG